MLNTTQPNSIIIGIDVSKDKLDICILPENSYQVIPNTPKEIKKFIMKLRERFSINQIKMMVMESTGGYEKTVAKLLDQAKLPIHIAHPSQVYYYAKSKKIFGKTDKIDCGTLARFGDEMDITPTLLPSDEDQELKELSTRTQQLTQILIAEKSRLKEHLKAEMKRSIHRMIKQIERELE
jgi:transposase